MKTKLEYIWLDGYEPTQNMRSKTKVIENFSGKIEDCPVWSFDGSSTKQAKGGSSDCLLKPVALYPDPDSDDLKETISNYYDLSKSNIFIGNGSDEILAFIFQALLKKEDPILFPDITYSFYPAYCSLYNIEYIRVPLDKDFNINLDDYLIPNGGIIFPNPNAPTGISKELIDIENLIKR